MVKSIIFDLGNVILFYDHKISLRKIAGLSGKTEPEIYDYFFATGYKDKFDRGEFTAEEFYRQVVEKLSISVDYDEFKLIWSDIFWQNEPIVELIGQLKQKYILYLLSNTDPIHFAYVLTKFKVLQNFNRYFVSYDLKIVKPDPEIYRTVVRELGVKPDELVYIDDNDTFTIAASKLGINSIVYRNPKQVNRELTNYIHR